MHTIILLISAVTLGQAGSLEGPHRRNDVYRSLVEEGFTIGQRKVAFPPPRIHDGQPAAQEKAALREVAGSERGLAEFLRDSVSAPFIMKVDDLTEGGEGPVRRASLWFAVHGELDALEKKIEGRQAEEDKPVEAGNMRFAGRALRAEEMAARKLDVTADEKALRVWYVHVSGRILDRIAVQATDRVVATRSQASWVIASRTDRTFDGDATFPNRWSAIVRKGEREESGTPAPYAGGASYVKVSPLTTEPGTLLVESHFAMAEPRPWFDGAPILRSKFSVIAQDQIRRLRRELADQKRSAAGAQGSR